MIQAANKRFLRGHVPSNNQPFLTENAAKAAMDRFKQEIANSMNIDLKEGYNGDISARDAGRIGGQMVKRMISYAEQNLKQD